MKWLTRLGLLAVGLGNAGACQVDTRGGGLALDGGTTTELGSGSTAAVDGDGTTSGGGNATTGGTTGGATSGAVDDSSGGAPIKFDLGAATTGAPPTVQCTDTLIARVRDLPDDFPDLTQVSDPDCSVAKPGLVEPFLDAAGNPVFASQGPGPQLTSAATFAQWYEDVPGVNIPFDVELPLTDNGTTQVYDSNDFFPIDGQGYGNNYLGHNFFFTTEVRMNFEYEPGQVFTFEGDDDFWLFIEGQLVIDLGGMHCELTDTVVLDEWADELGLVEGGVYEMAIFHAERGVFNSNFTIETNIACLAPPVG